ncbi:MAG: hypothetical protein ABI893_01030 [Polaromonas sp.]|uniref:hypothetical protein n=1 Tax=Polaromonas sp. TaxID=1869339 RepID=UPI003264ABA4
MEFFTLVVFTTIALFALKWKEERQRIALLGSHLGHYQIEKLMETLAGGYLRALGEKEPARREQVWQQLANSEGQLAAQFSKFAAEFAKVPEPAARVSRLPIGLPFITQALPAMTFDMRQALAIHAAGIARVAQNAAELSPKAKAFTMSAELFLMQHTCHWFCKSKAIASARVLVRHQTPHTQLVESVSPETREAYRALTGGGR